MGSSIRYLLLPLIIFQLLTGCTRKEHHCSFYYWRTGFTLDSMEKEALEYNQVKDMYVRYFDVDFPPADSFPTPVSPLVFHDTLPAHLHITPVVFLRNRVFERSDSPAIRLLAQKVFHLVTTISNTAHADTTARIQFDCDWTEKTAHRYFFFLDQYRLLSHQQVSCTIRLHQVRYPQRTGIPPLDRGILMYYNMGDIDAGAGNSIYDPAIAARYIPSLRTYPIHLDIALPIFSWGLHVRDGHVIALLNKMNFLHFYQDSNFTRMDSDRYQARAACFSGGYYFREKDIVKIEHVDGDGLKDIMENILRYTNKKLGDVIFFDLDKTNLILYDKKVFKEVLDQLY